MACMRKSSFSSWPLEACKNSRRFFSGMGCSSSVAFTIFRLLIGVFYLMGYVGDQFLQISPLLHDALLIFPHNFI